MRKYRYLVLGTGVGKAIAWWLLQHQDTERVMLVDLSFEKAIQAVKGLVLTNEQRERIVAQAFDIVKDEAKLPYWFGTVDVVVSALPAALSPDVARAAIDAGTHFCDLGGVIPITRKVLDLKYDAEKKGVSVISDNGIMPGLGNIMALDLADTWDEGADSVTITSGGIPLNPEPKHFNYQQVYSAAGTRHIAYDKVPELKKGEVVYCDPLDTFITLKTPEVLMKLVPDMNLVEKFTSSGAALAPWYLQAKGVQEFREWTLRWPGFKRLLCNTREEKFEKVFANLPKLGPLNPDIMYLQVRAESKYGSYAEYELVETFDEDSGLAAIERTTGFPAALMALWQARGYIPPGARTADHAFESNKDRALFLGEVGNWLSWTYTSD